MATGTELGSLYYDLSLDSTKLEAGLASAKEQMSGFSDKASEAWGNATKSSQIFAAGIAVAGAATVAFGLSAVKAFEKSEDGITQTQAVLRSTAGVAGVTADMVDKLSKSLEKQTTFSDEDVRSVTNLLLTFTSISKDIMPQATSTVLDMATALGEDTKSAAIQLGKALQDPVLGITALRRVGVNFSDDQKKVIQNLVDTGQKAQAQQLILKELNTEFGGSATAASQTFSGALKQLGNQFDDVKEIIGGAIVKALDPFIGRLSTWIYQSGGAEGVINKLTDALKKLKPYIPEIAGAIFAMLVPALWSATTALWSFLWPLVLLGAVGAAIVYITKKIIDALGGWHKTWLLLQSVAKPIIDIFETLIKQLKKDLQPALATIKEHWDAIKKVLLVIMAAALAPLVIAIAMVIAIVLAIIVVIIALVKIFNFVNEVIKVVYHSIISAWQFIGSVFKTVTKTIMEVLQTIWDTIVKVFKAIWGFLEPWFNFLKNIFVIVFGAILLVVITWVKTLWTIITTVWNDIYNAVSTTLTAVWNFIVNIWQSIYNTISGFIQGIINFFAPAVTWLFDKGKDIVNGLVNGIEDVAGAVWGAIKGVADQIGSFFAGAWHWLFDTGKAIVQGLIDGIKSIAGDVAKAAQDVANTVTDKIKGALKINSPSLVMAEIGGSVGEGMVKGIKDSIPSITDAAGQMVKVGVTNPVSDSSTQTAQMLATPNPNQAQPQGNIVINVDMKGIMARTRSELRDIGSDMIDAVNEKLKAQGKPLLGV